MNEKQAFKIFEKYNPADSVTRCPNGRAQVRKLLDTYAKAAVNLYGVIGIKEFAEIFNGQNTEHTNADEVFALLLPLVLKSKWYCFYKDHIVHYWAIEDFDFADYWIKVQGDKPRYIPAKDELLKYENEYYECETQVACWEKLREYAKKIWPENYKTYLLISELKEVPELSTGVNELSEIFDKFGLVFDDQKQAQEFINLYMEARNNTRIWSNKGYSPNELRKLLEDRQPDYKGYPVLEEKKKKVGRNEPCPCGRGRKYKDCCLKVEESQIAQLSRSDCRLFYETWYGLMSYINEREKIIRAEIKPVYPNTVSDEQIFKVREILWNDPKLIDDYLSVARLPKEKTDLIKSWRDHRISGKFVLVEYTPEYAVAIGSNEKGEDILYGIKGISRPLSAAMQRELPTIFETVLLPFKNQIIYDCFLSPMSVGFASGAKKMFDEMYEKALKNGIVTSLD